MFKNLLLLVALIALSSCKSKDVSIMTYNIRMNTPNDKENAWPERVDFLTTQVSYYAPDIMGVQEALPGQIENLNSKLENYSFIGKGRDANSTGEYSAIYYNHNKYKVENQNTFWLSETPTILSKSWDAALPRICTYGLFTNLKTGLQLWVFNTHLDHVGAVSRVESVKLIMQKIEEVNEKKIPVVFMGDLNVEPSSDVISQAKKSLEDTYEVANLTYGSVGTFNGFNYNKSADRRIDYIMVSKMPTLIVEKYAVFNESKDLRFPSDHFPVLVNLSFH